MAAPTRAARAPIAPIAPTTGTFLKPAPRVEVGASAEGLVIGVSLEAGAEVEVPEVPGAEGEPEGVPEGVRGVPEGVRGLPETVP